jgi:hypothetical protein
MAKGISPKNGGNRRAPASRMGVGNALPTNHTTTYGNKVAGTNKGGGSIAPKGGGNRSEPKSRMGVGNALPTKYDTSDRIK